MVSKEAKDLYEPIGLYFEAVAIARQGKAKEKSAAIKTLEHLCEATPAAIRASSLLSLGIYEQEQGKNQEAKRLFLYAATLSENVAPVTHFLSLSAVSGILSQEGANRQSLDILQSIHPAVVYWGGVYPALLGEQLNNLAYELCQLGELRTSWDYINKACLLQTAVHHPEWLNTKKEIAAKRAEQKSDYLTAIPRSYGQYETIIHLARRRRRKIETLSGEPAKVLQFHRSLKSNKILRVCWHYKEVTDILWDFYLDRQHLKESAIIQLLCRLDDLRATTATDVHISVQLVQDQVTLFHSDMKLSESNIQPILELCNEIEAGFAFSPFAQRHKYMTEAEIKERTASILQIIATNKRDRT